MTQYLSPTPLDGMQVPDSQPYCVASLTGQEDLSSSISPGDQALALLPPRFPATVLLVARLSRFIR
jgi:hypothetical protein